MHDIRQLIRYLRLSVRTENPLHIQTEKIVLGGHSAGAIVAMLIAYFDESDFDDTSLESQMLASTIRNHGGIEGVYREYEETTDIDCVINLSGGVSTLEMIDANEVPMLLVHGTADEVVDYQDVIVFGQTYLYASESIAARAADVSLPHEYLLLEEGDHFSSTQNEESFLKIGNFLNDCFR